jgi:large conductance mechanosensitive channel
MLKEFKAFVLRGNVVDLAVAVVIGAAFGAVVTSFVNNILTPLIGIIGKNDFSTLHFTINDSVFRYGEFINALISFVLIAAAIFFAVVKPLNVLAERRKRGEVTEEEVPELSDEAILLSEIRDLLRAGRPQ